MSREISNIKGRRYGRLIAVKIHHRDKKLKTFWECRCDCGNLKVTSITCLTTKKTKSCGCLVMDIMTKNKYGKIHGMTRSRFYRIWTGMNSRCNNEKEKGYKYYGKKGVKVFWKSFIDFKKDMYDSYASHIKVFGERNTTIDRIDTTGNYKKNNCRWATYKEQANNKRMHLTKVLSTSGINKALV